MKDLISSFRHNTDFRFLVLLAALSFIPALGAVHLFDWDEINFAESAREMLVTGDYFRVQVNFSPFWEKPPLFFWLQALSMKIFGVNEFAARFPNAMVGIATIVALYRIGKREKGEKFGLIWAFLYLLAFLPQVYFRSAIIDPLFNLFIFLSAYNMIRVLRKDEKGTKYAFLAGLYCGLSVLTKGPVGFLLIALTFVVYLIIKRFKVWPSLKEVGIFALMVLVVSFFWFGIEVIQNGPWFLVEFVKYQIELFAQPVAGHEQPFFYHFVIVFIGTFPLCALALPFIFKGGKNSSEIQTWWRILFWVVLILFSIVKTKIVHYSSMTYLPLSFLAAEVIFYYKWKEIPSYARIVFLIQLFLFGIIFIGLPLFGILNHYFTPYIKDPFAVAGFNNPDVVWTGVEPFFVILYAVGFYFLLKAWKNDRIVEGLKWGAAGFSIALSLTMIFVVQKIESYSQGPMIEFLEDHSGEEVYVHPVGMKTYAPYFYFQQSQEINAFSKIRKEKFNDEAVLYTPLEAEVRQFVLYGPVEYEVLFISKVNHFELDTIPHLEFMYQKGGFKFFKRPLP